jgi:TRAP-type uncharacterized transport system fused permease subunit
VAGPTVICRGLRPEWLGQIDEFPVYLGTIFLLLSIEQEQSALRSTNFFAHKWAWESKAVAVAVCLLVTFLLYRDIRSRRLSIVLWVVVIFTALAVTAAGLLNFQVSRILTFHHMRSRLQNNS